MAKQHKFVSKVDDCPKGWVDATTPKMKAKGMKVKLCATPEMAAKIKAKRAAKKK